MLNDDKTHDLLQALAGLSDPDVDLRDNPSAFAAVNGWVYALWSNWTPTAENINALPVPVRAYVHAMGANADPAGTVAENTLLRDQTRQLDAMIGRLKAEAEQYDVRKILLRVTPGLDGMGQEEYAKNTDEVVAELTALSEKAEYLAARPHLDPSELTALADGLEDIAGNENAERAAVLLRKIANWVAQ